jgi:hypothetical protein
MKKEFKEVHQDVAFPSIVETYNKIFYTKGLSKREYFASQAMNALVGNFLIDTETEMETLASVAVCMAEALLHELNKTNSQP